MKQLISLLTFSTFMLFACKKDTTQPAIVGQWVWTIQYANNPVYNSTPQSTGIQESILFNTNGTYSLTQNNSIINSGTYKTSSATSTSGENVASILYTNTRVTDSVAYYKIVDNGDSLVFSYDLIGTAGSGARYYGRK